MRVYIAGPMRGMIHSNFDTFDAAAEELRKLGHEPVSPADLDRQGEGWGQYPPEGYAPTREDLARFMLRDLEAVSRCDGMLMLPGSQDSWGARVERAFATYLGIPVWFTMYSFQMEGAPR